VAHNFDITGVPAVPPRAVGYLHFCDDPFYAFRRKLYRVPKGQKEFSLFRVDGGLSGATPDKPLGDPVSTSSPPKTNVDVDGSTIRSPKSKDGSDVPADWMEVRISKTPKPGFKHPSNAGGTAKARNSFPRGGHNYYNGRDLEAFRRTTDRLHAANFPGANWKERFRGRSTCAGGVDS
jgi:hypothetical protein